MAAIPTGILWTTTNKAVTEPRSAPADSPAPTESPSTTEWIPRPMTTMGPMGWWAPS